MLLLIIAAKRWTRSLLQLTAHTKVSQPPLTGSTRATEVGNAGSEWRYSVCVGGRARSVASALQLAYLATVYSSSSSSPSIPPLVCGVTLICTHIRIYQCKSRCVVCMFACLYLGQWILIRYVQRLFSDIQLSAWSAWFGLRYLPSRLPARLPAHEKMYTYVRCVLWFCFCFTLLIFVLYHHICCCCSCCTLCYYTISSLFIIVCFCFAISGSAQCCCLAFQHFVAIKYSFICHFLLCLIILLAFQ